MSKTNTFTLNQFQLERFCFKKTMKKLFKGTEEMLNNFFKPGLKIAIPFISAGVAAKTGNPQSAQKTTRILKSLTGGKLLSLTDLHGNVLRLKVM